MDESEKSSPKGPRREVGSSYIVQSHVTKTCTRRSQVPGERKRRTQLISRECIGIIIVIIIIVVVVVVVAPCAENGSRLYAPLRVEMALYVKEFYRQFQAERETIHFYLF